ncbi:MAG TPA: hypothetical protein PKH39_11355 [Woeseiaceae bacterium]|nr:hypothetical protein [Woeseiaceae bacterium]
MVGDINDIDDIDDIDDVEDDDSVDDDDDDIAGAIADGDIEVDFGETVGDLSAEFNVEELVARIEATDAKDVAERARIRKRLEEIREMKESELDDTYNFKFDDD